MADVVQTTPAASRGRPSGRSSRGGYSSRGGGRQATRQSNIESTVSTPSLDEQGEIGQLKKQYLSQIEILEELFPDWTDDDLAFALQETDGDLQRTIERITEGNVSQFADVKKKTKEKSRAKKEASAPAESQPVPTRGRGRGGTERGHGGRGRGSDRGGRVRVGRGAAMTGANGARKVSAGASIPTAETTGWGDSQVNTTAVIGGWDQNGTIATIATTHPSWNPDTLPAASLESQKSALIPVGSKKSWASMLSQPNPPRAVAQKAMPPLAPPAIAAGGELAVHSQVTDAHALLDPPPGLQPLIGILPSTDQQAALADFEQAPSYAPSLDSGAHLAPPKDLLTEDNVESLPDESLPASTDTVASTRDPGSAVGSGTPYGSSRQTSTASRPPLGGYATTAWKAAGAPGRAASYQRKMMEQREAVVMPGNHAVDRAAVQFGSMGLNGENRPLDVDDDREEAQTRTQPQQSPPSQPRASLPPAPRQAPITEEPPIQQEVLLTPKQAPGLPQLPHTSQNLNQSGSQMAQQYGQHGRFPGGALNQESGAPAQKQYDPFSQHLNYSQQQQDAQGIYSTHSQASNQPPQTQTHLGGFSQSLNDYGNQYSNEQQRSAYQSYYGSSYGQQNPSAQQQDQNVPPQRSSSGFAAGDSGYGSSQANASQARFAESQNSGHTTPNPAVLSQQQMAAQTQQSQPMHQQAPGQAGPGGNFQYGGSPYYGNSYYGSSYMNQYPNSYYSQQGYGGAPFGGKGGNMYAQPHHNYGLSPQASYEQSSSPANAQNYGSSTAHGRESAMSASGGDYGRSGSAQQTQQNPASGNAFTGAMADSFARNATGFSQNQQYGQQQQQSEDGLKPFSESKAGPSPSLAQAGRAGSAANQSNFPAQQSQQQGFGGYPSHLNQVHNSHGSQYGGLGGLGGHQGSAQSHQASGYGSYPSGFAANNYGNYGRGGWGGNYGH